MNAPTCWREAVKDMNKPTREPLTGYDGSKYDVGDRVEIHPATDLWMRGARFGTVVGRSLTRDDRVKVKMDKDDRIRSGQEQFFRLLPEWSP